MSLSKLLAPAYPLFAAITADKSGLIARAAQWLAENRQVFEALSYITAMVMCVFVGVYQIRQSRKKHR